MSSSDNKRIAKNTLMLYGRMAMIMVVSLFTSRVVLAALGVDDYGVYNVVGGLSSALIFFSSTLTVSTQRFLNYELGKGNSKRVKDIFNTCLLLFIAIAVAVLIIGATAGQWLVTNKLVIPEHQRGAALVVLYCTIISLGSTFIFSVYESVLIERENMKIYAYIGIVDAFAKLAIAYLMVVVSNKLIMYAVLMMVVQILPKLCMAIYCTRKYEEVSHEWIWSKDLFKELTGFTGWNLYGATVWMVNGQGINILLNMFFGPVVNAANGIAAQVNNAVNNFSANFFTAVRPQIVKRYAADEHDSLISLVYASSRFSFYMLWCISLPLILRCDYVLGVWLKEVPEYASQFVQWVLIYSIVNSFNNPVWTAMTATGHLRRSVIVGSNLFLLAFPASYIALKLGASPESVYPILSLGRFAFLLVTLHNISKFINLSISKYFRHVFAPVCYVICITTAVCALFSDFLPNNFLGLIAFCLISLAVNAVTIFTTGITSGERQIIKRKVNLILHRHEITQ